MSAIRQDRVASPESSVGHLSIAMRTAIGNRRRDETGMLAKGRPCPRCNGTTHRIPRNFMDLLVSMFVMVRRYRCQYIHCGWEGTLRERRRGLQSNGAMGGCNILEPSRLGKSFPEKPIP